MYCEPIDIIRILEKNNIINSILHYVNVGIHNMEADIVLLNMFH